MSVQAGPAEAELAMQSAVDGAAAMRRLSGYARSTLLQKVAQSLQVRQEEFARMMMAESGKPVTDARREVGRAIQTFAIAAEEAKRDRRQVGAARLVAWHGDLLGGDQAVSDRSDPRHYARFNFPLNLVVHKVAPALAAGNSILIKPAPDSADVVVVRRPAVAGGRASGRAQCAAVRQPGCGTVGDRSSIQVAEFYRKRTRWMDVEGQGARQEEGGVGTGRQCGCDR